MPTGVSYASLGRPARSTLRCHIRLTNAAGRRGVISGTAAQGTVISLPVGHVCYITVAVLTSAHQGFERLSASSVVWLSATGLIHFVIGRYCNF
jgi:hypothetical protein